MNNDNFLIVLFKNKTRKKIIKKFKTSKRALDFFNKISSESDKVIFNREYEKVILVLLILPLLRNLKKNYFHILLPMNMGEMLKLNYQMMIMRL